MILLIVVIHKVIKIKIMEITKEQVIKMWDKYSSRILDNNDVAESANIVSIRMTKNVELTLLMTNEYSSLAIVFGGIIRYKSFELSHAEAENCFNVLNEIMNKNRLYEKDELMQAGTDDMELILSEI